MPKTFDVDDDLANTEPETFTIVGSRGNGERFEELFSTVLELPVGVIDDVANSCSVMDDGRVAYSRHHVLRLIRTAITPDHRDRWDDLVRDTDRIVKLDKLVPVMLWLIGALSDRPTGPLSNSPGGTAATGNGSAANSSDKDSAAATSTG